MLSDFEKARYEWQMWSPGVGEAGQEKLKRARVLISRGGGVGGTVALQLAAAGVGTLRIAHAGNLKPADLNRQLLMTHDHIGKPRHESIERRLRELNPLIDIRAVPENISEDNVDALVGEVDLIVDCAPLFPERYAMNRASVAQGKPMVECAMFDSDAYLTTFLPGETGCLACLHPRTPPEWKRQFPVFGAVSGTVACMAAYEAIKYFTGVGELLAGTLLQCDLAQMKFRRLPLARKPGCAVCGTGAGGGEQSSGGPPRRGGREAPPRFARANLSNAQPDSQAIDLAPQRCEGLRQALGARPAAMAGAGDRRALATASRSATPQRG